MKNLYYFADCSTLDELKATYKRLAKANHPDAGGSDEVMAAINAEYDEAVRCMARGTDANAQRAAAEAPEAFRAAVMAVIHVPGLTVELCGCWLWVSGNTYPAKGILKAAGYIWCHKKKMWYWRPADAAAVKRGRSSLSMDEIRMKYGSEIVNSGAVRLVLS